MDVRFLPNDRGYQRMTTEELRGAFVLERLFIPGKVSLVWCDADRAILGGVVPAEKPLALSSSKKEMAAEYFAERREVGVVNIGGKGSVATDGAEHTLERNDMLYIGRGTKAISLSSARANDPAVYFVVSFPAHASYPTTLIPYRDAEKASLGSAEGANRRTIHKYIHTGGVKSCQLVMGLTELESGSVWNTMPPHTHLRRMEVYLYYGLDPDALVVHLMGKPDETRSLLLHDREGVISPAWSIHTGAATKRYTFIWAMGGENQEFADMDPVSPEHMR